MKLQWTEVILTSWEHWLEWKSKFTDTAKLYGAFDTETSGLSIIYDKPFVFQFGWVSLDETEGWAFAIEMDNPYADEIIDDWHKLAKTLRYYVGQNVKYDMHMMENVELPYIEDNLLDTMILIRMAHDNIPVRFGGVPLGLKPYAVKYIDPAAKDHDKLLQAERSQIAKTLNQKLSARLKDTPPPPAEWGIGKSWGVGAIKSFFKDQTNTPQDFPSIQNYMAYQDWLNEDVPECMRNRFHNVVVKDDVPYTLLNRANLLQYALKDIVYTLEILLLTIPTILARKQWEAVKFEQELIIPLYDMERVGFKLNKPYIYQSYLNMKEYLRSTRSYLNALTGSDFTCNQGQKIQEWVWDMYEITLPDTSSATFDRLLNSTTPPENLKEVLRVIQELRTLEKWFTTYLMRFIYDARLGDYSYTQINQVGAASGRVSSDFQQFPKGAIYTSGGTELFNPRKCIIPHDEYRGILYYDYSQIELRIQAQYTVLLGEPDLNLCRAYMPYKCINAEGVDFDYTNRNHLADWDGEWYYGEQPWNWEPWVPTDVHGATTKAAFDIDETHPDFKKLRGDGKRVNFAKNYGAQLGMIETMFPDMCPSDIRKIDAGYYKAFPSIKKYQQYCYAIGDYQSFATNLFGIKYYNVSGHKLINMLIQGSGAYLLKKKIKECHKYLKDQGGKSKMQMNIHDEISVLPHPDTPPQVFVTFKHILEIWPGMNIPIVADVELTTTTWAEKKEVDINEAIHDWS